MTTLKISKCISLSYSKSINKADTLIQVFCWILKVCTNKAVDNPLFHSLSCKIILPNPIALAEKNWPVGTVEQCWLWYRYLITRIEICSYTYLHTACKDILSGISNWFLLKSFHQVDLSSSFHHFPCGSKGYWQIC